MKWWLEFFIAVPLLGFLVSLLLSGNSEKALSRTAWMTIALHLGGVIPFLVYWLWQGAPVVNLAAFTLFQDPHNAFIIDFYFDKVTAVFLVVGSFLTLLITLYSRVYLHREAGYKRFFNTILFFFSGYQVVIFGGNFETLFLGWEMLGLSSFLLIAFYRDRYLPVRNAVKVFSVYRIGDVGLLLAMWASHHLWKANIPFMQLNNYDLVHQQLEQHGGIGLFISLMILLGAAAKSAQLPFSSWLPRAMEGPTPSSAIFYGALSVHLGVFLLLRTWPFWEHQLTARILIGLTGATTAALGYAIARVQATAKSQIAYASVAQIGLIFVEMALGWRDLALLHFAGNAFLRSYQLLISPSVVSYLIREQFYHHQKREHSIEDSYPKRLEYTFYLLSLKEWHLDEGVNRLFFAPLKKLGHRLDFLKLTNVFWFFGLTFGLALWLFPRTHILPPQLAHYLPEIFSGMALLLVLKAFSERKYPRLVVLLIAMSHAWLALATSFNEHYDANHVLWYLGGVVPATLLAYACLEYLRRREAPYFDLQQYYGHQFEYPRLGFVFLLAILGQMGFPISPSFVGEDLLYSHIHEDEWLMAFFSALSFVVGGIALIRVYARLFLGPHIKTYHHRPWRSA